MIVYFLTLSAVGVCFAVRNSNLTLSRRSKDFWYYVAWMILLLVLALRYNVGTDYPHYVINYRSYVVEDLDISDMFGAGLVAKIGSLFLDDYAMWFFLMGVITVVPCALIIRRESISVCLSSVLYVVLCCWHTSFNIVMQSAATSILLLGYTCLRDRKFLKWCIYCVLASLFHVTALGMILVYFLVTPRVSWKRVGLLVVVGIAIALLYDQLFNVMGLLSSGTMTESMDSTYGARQLNPLRVLVNCAPAVMGILLLKHLDRSDKQVAILFNMSLFNAVLNIGTMNSAYLNRFAIYTIIYNALFIPYLMRTFGKKTRILVWCILLGLYTLFWAYDLMKSGDTVNYYWIFQRG